MKIFKNIKTSCLALAIMAMVPTGCQDVLEQEFRSELTPTFFSTPEGLQFGLNASYAISRYFWGSEGFVTSAVAGTDEVVRSGDGGTEFHFYQILPNSGSIQSIWDNSYLAINNLNGVLQFGPDAAIPEAQRNGMMGEAKFLRAYYYFLLVQNFGDVPLNLTFNTVPSTIATRTPVKEVYAAILKDLTEAIEQLPNTPASLPSKGRVSKAAALHLLAKVYLTKGWKENAREGNGQSDFENAYNTANTLITNRATYGVDLEQNYADVHRNGNEYGKEVLFVADRNTDPIYSESNYSGASGQDGNKENRLNHYWVSFYTLPRNVNERVPNAPTSTHNLSRDVNYGRPFRRFRPTQYTYDAFNNRAFDSRYDNTFQKVWIVNTPSTSSALVQSNITNPMVTTRNGVTYTLQKGIDTAFYMPGRVVTVEERQRFKGAIIDPSQYSLDWFPTMTKHLDNTRLGFDDPSDRPIILMRLGETYLIAAEAAFKAGRPDDAVAMLNVLRRRAAFRAAIPNTANPLDVNQNRALNAGRRLDQAANDAANAAAAAALQVSGGDITLNFILEERTREMYGEINRWYDLARTNTLVQRVRQYNPEEGGRNIKEHHILRPIPSVSQLDLLTNRGTVEEGFPGFPQNPGY